MAIWDSSANSVTCPTCGDALRFDSAIKCSVCRSCGNVYEPGTLNVTGKFRFIDVNEASEAEENKREYVCDACGATVVTDKDTAATFCAFCGSPTLISRRLTREFRPDYVIPFKVGRDEAERIYKEWAVNGKNLPKRFTSSAVLKKITGIYVPFWLMNAECHAHIEGMGFMQESRNSRAVYDFTREFLFKVRNVPFDGSLAISNFLMAAIEPFDFDSLVPYDDTYIPGYYAMRYDKNALDMTDIIDIRLSKYAAQAGKLMSASSGMGGTGAYTDITPNVSESYVKNLTQTYAMLPIWFLNCEYKGETYTIVINGQTGKISGDVPVSGGSVFANALKKNLKNGLAALGLAFLAIIISAGIISTNGEWGILEDLPVTNLIKFGIPVFGVVLLITACTNFAKKFITGVYNDRLENSYSLDDAPEVEEYFDFQYTPKLIDKKDKFIGFQRRVDTSDRAYNYREKPNFEWTWV